MCVEEWRGQEGGVVDGGADRRYVVVLAAAVMVTSDSSEVVPGVDRENDKEGGGEMSLTFLSREASAAASFWQGHARTFAPKKVLQFGT